MEPSDAELVVSFLAGDDSSFRQLYERHYALAVGIARSRLYDVHLAEDAAQESFAIAFRTLTSLVDHTRFAQWLGTICRRTASSLSRKHRPHESLIDEVVESSEIDHSHLRQQIHQSLQTLDESSREIVMLHYFSELSYDQISTVLQLSPQAIHGRLQRARRTLRKVLKPKESIE